MANNRFTVVEPHGLQLVDKKLRELQQDMQQDMQNKMRHALDRVAQSRQALGFALVDEYLGQGKKEMIDQARQSYLAEQQALGDLEAMAYVLQSIIDENARKISESQPSTAGREEKLEKYNTARKQFEAAHTKLSQHGSDGQFKKTADELYALAVACGKAEEIREYYLGLATAGGEAYSFLEHY